MSVPGRDHDPAGRDAIDRLFDSASAGAGSPIDQPDLTGPVLDRVSRSGRFLSRRQRRRVWMGRAWAAAGSLAVVGVLALGHRVAPGPWSLAGGPEPVTAVRTAMECDLAPLRSVTREANDTAANPLLHATVQRTLQGVVAPRHELAMRVEASGTVSVHTASFQVCGAMPGAGPLVMPTTRVLIIDGEPVELRLLHANAVVRTTTLVRYAGSEPAPEAGESALLGPASHDGDALSSLP